MIDMRFYVLLSIIVAAGCNYSLRTPPPPKYDDPASNVLIAQKHGWKIVDEKGNQLFCRADSVTGSRVRTRTICMTPKEWAEFARRAERNAVEGIHGRQPCLAPQCASGG
jgi:hypothetical protein